MKNHGWESNVEKETEIKEIKRKVGERRYSEVIKRETGEYQ